MPSRLAFHVRQGSHLHYHVGLSKGSNLLSHLSCPQMFSSGFLSYHLICSGCFVSSHLFWVLFACLFLNPLWQWTSWNLIHQAHPWNTGVRGEVENWLSGRLCAAHQWAQTASVMEEEEEGGPTTMEKNWTLSVSDRQSEWRVRAWYWFSRWSEIGGLKDQDQRESSWPYPTQNTVWCPRGQGIGQHACGSDQGMNQVL